MKSTSNQKFLKDRKDLRKVDLKPDRRLRITGRPNHRKRLIRGIWNRCGGLLGKLSAILKIDPAVAVAILCAESTGRGFDRRGRMIIRFENHIFWKYWGKSHPSGFLAHFKFDRRKPWQGHKFRKGLKDEWDNFHSKGQAGEWEAFEFACSKHRRFTMHSISMGMPQIMGFNYRRIGYESAKKMFDSFAAGERNQMVGLFDFIKSGNLEMIRSLRRANFPAFARLYNGPGKAEVYAARIEKYCQEFRELTQKNVDKGMC